MSVAMQLSIFIESMVIAASSFRRIRLRAKSLNLQSVNDRSLPIVVSSPSLMKYCAPPSTIETFSKRM